jgi:hypothetical protein
VKLIRNMRNVGAAGALTMAFSFGAAHASVIYQSVPDLTAAPSVNAWCSQCSSDGVDIGQTFTLGSGAVADTLSFVVQNGSSNAWPTSVTVDIFQDAGASTLGADLFHQTISTFVSDTPTGNGTDVVTISLGKLSMAAGTYEIFMTNPDNLGIPGFSGGANGEILDLTADASSPTSGPQPSSGDEYVTISSIAGGNYDAGIILDGTAVPEPATWAMLILGVAMVGFAARRRNAGAAIAA